MKVMVRYSEIALKSDQTRAKFLRVLVSTIKKRLPEATIRSERGRIYLETGDRHFAGKLSKIFGIHSFSIIFPAAPTLEDMSRVALKEAKQIITSKDTFAVRAHKAGSHKISRFDIGTAVGAAIADDTGAKVDLDNPTKEIFVELRDREAYIFTQRTMGPSGLPYGVSGKAAAVLDTPESVLAAWMVAKRGCELVFCATEDFDIAPLKPWFDEINLHRSKNPFEMAHDICKNEGAKAIVVSESDPKKASMIQASAFPVFHPLISFSKDEITSLMRSLFAQG